MNVGIIVIVVNVVVNTLRSSPVQAERGKKTKLMSRLDSMHAFISRTIIIIVIPLSMRQSYAVVVIVKVNGIGIIIIVIVLSSSSVSLSLFMRAVRLPVVLIYQRINKI